VTILYRYRPFTPELAEREIDALQRDGCWFAHRMALNDIYDSEIRLPKAITNGEIRRIHELMRTRSYVPSGSAQADLLDAIEKSADPLTRLGLMTEYSENPEFLQALRDRTLDVGFTVVGVKHSLKKYFNAITVLCLSETATNKVLWSHYASSYRGFCIGYETKPDHPLANRLRPVHYLTHRAPVDLAEAVYNTIELRDSLIYTKHVDYQHETEWRVTVMGQPGFRSAPLRMKQVIFGAAMQPAEKERLRAAVRDRNVWFGDARPAFRAGFQLEIADAWFP
jgi:hypothetical protein